MNRIPGSFLSRGALVAIAFGLAGLVSCLPAQAQTTRTWVGADGDMSVAENWTPTGVPSTSAGDQMLFDGSGSGTVLTFPATTFNGSDGLGHITVAAGQTGGLSIANSGSFTGASVFRLRPNANLTIQSGAGAFSMGTSGNGFYLNLANHAAGNQFINQSGNLATLGPLVTLNASAGTGGHAIFDGTGNWRVEGNITGAITRGIIKNGTGTLTLANTNTYTGATTISGGTLRLEAPAASLPSGLSGLVAHWDAAAITGVADGARLDTWTDSAGGTHNATRDGGSPVYLENGGSGLPVVRFQTDGNSWYNFSEITNIRTVFFLGREQSPGNSLNYFLGHSSSYHFHRGDGDRIWHGTHAHANIKNGQTYLDGNQVNGTTTTFGAESVKLLSLVTTGNVSANQLSRDRTQGGRSWRGDIGEILIFNQALSGADRLAVEQYLTSKWFGVLPSATAVTLTDAGAALDLNGVNQTIGSLAGVEGSQVLLGGGTLTTGKDDATTTFSGVIADGGAPGGGLTKYGTGTLTLAGNEANTYTGPTVLQSGRLHLAKTGGAYAIPGDFIGVNHPSPVVFTTQDNQFAPGSVMYFTGSTGDHVRFELLGTTQTLAGIDNTGAGVRGVIQHRERIDAGLAVGTHSTLILDVAAGGDYYFGGYLRDTGGTLSLVKDGPGTQTLAGGNITYTGGTMIDGGEIALASANVGRGNWTVNNGAILRGTATDAINSINSITVNAGGRLIQAGGSYQQLTAPATGGGPALILNGGRLEATVGGHGNYGNFLLRGNMVVGGTSTSVIAADFRMGDNATRTFTVNPTGDPSGIDLDIQDYFSHFHGVTWGYMIKEGAGTMRFAPTSSGNVGSMTVSAGKVLFDDAIQTMGNGGLNNNATVEVYRTSGVNQNFGSRVQGAGTFIKSGPGTFQFNGGGQLIAQGQFLIQQGTLQNSNNSVNWSGNTGNVDISAGAILDLYADPIYLNNLNGSGIVQNNYGNASGQSGSSAFYEKLIVGVANGSSTFDGTIRDNATGASLGSGVGRGGIELEKRGTGILTLSGASTYTGPTTINAGTLLVNGSLGNTAVAVNSGGTLGGTGSIGGAVTVHGGGLLSPGASTGVLTMGSLAMETGSTTLMEIDGLVRGDEYDGIDITVDGGLAYGGTLSLAFNLAGLVPAGTVFDLFHFTGTPTGAFDEVVSTGFYAGGANDWVYDDLDDTFSLEFGWQTLLFSHATGDLTVIPEPGTWLLLLAAAACGLLLRRRK